MKLIMENWRKFINEADFNQDGALQPDELRGLATKLEKENLNEQVNTRLIKSLDDLRKAADRKNRNDVYVATNALLRHNRDGAPNFERFEAELESALKSSKPGELLNVAVNAVLKAYRQLEPDAR